MGLLGSVLIALVRPTLFAETIKMEMWFYTIIYGPQRRKCKNTDLTITGFILKKKKKKRSVKVRFVFMHMLTCYATIEK